MVSLGSTPVHDIEIVPAHNRLEVALVHDDERNLRVELAEVPHLAVLLRDKALGEHRQLDEEMALGKIEVWPKPAHGDTTIVPLERKFEWLVDTLVTVEREELRKQP